MVLLSEVSDSKLASSESNKILSQIYNFRLKCLRLLIYELLVTKFSIDT